MRTLFRSLLALVAAVLAALGTVVIGVRTKNPQIVGLVRRTLRDRANPQALGTAGAPGQSHGVIIHVGRTSGRERRTPVTPVPTDDGFVIALPYGPDSDWVRNVLAAGSATLVTDGEQVSVERPEVRPFKQFEGVFPPSSRIGTRIFGVTSCLVLYRTSAPPAQD